MDAVTRIKTLVDKTSNAGRPHPVRMNVDAEIACALLKRNTRNRTLRDGRVERYRSDMLAGAWAENGEAIKVSVYGELIDGQHRLEAIAGTDLVVPMLVVFGVSDEAAETIDQGAPRNAGDYLAMRGEPYAGLAARIIRLRLAYERNEGEALKDVSRPTNAEVLRYFGEHKDEVLHSAKIADDLREYAQPLVTPAILGLAHNILSEIDGNDAERFIEQVAKGEEIHEGDPAYAVRNRLLKMGRAGAARKVEPVLTGWNAYRTKRPLKTVRVTGKLPALAA